MKIRADLATLKVKVGDPGFTPSVRDARLLFSLLADPDELVARDAERALARMGVGLVPVAVVHARTALPEVQAGIARLLGRFAEEEDARGWLIEALGSAEARIRRAAARALGKGAPPATKSAPPSPEVERALLEAFDREPNVSERRAIAAALGKVGSEHALDRLRALTPDDPELARITAKSTTMLARQVVRRAHATSAVPGADRGRSIALGTIDGARAPEVPLHVVIHCRRGLESLMRDEAADKCAPWLTLDASLAEPEAVHGLSSAPMRALFAIRTMTGFAFEIAREPVNDAADVERVLVEALLSERARVTLETFTIGPVRYRIAWESGGHRRAAVWRSAGAVSKHRPQWINDPTESTWEVVARELRDERGLRVTIELRPRALVDPRFAYRERDVPAASHPTLAAALVRVAGVRADDVVWDPFVGSGTELVERALAGPYASLHGSDIDGRALAAARVNFAAASLAGVELVCADATKHAPPGVTLVLTNPPMGRRVARTAELGAVLDEVVDHVGRILGKGGRFVWLSPLPSRTLARAKRAGLTLEGARDVDMGGFQAQLQHFTKDLGTLPSRSRSTRTMSRRGFTLVEMMIVVAIVGVLAMIATFAARKFIANGKTAEARNSLGQLGKDAATTYAKETFVGTAITPGMALTSRHRLCGSASATVPASLTSIKGKKYQATIAEWSVDAATNNGFACLRFGLNDPQYFMYNYTLSGTGDTVGNTFTATANGDLNGDGVTSTFSIAGSIVPGTLLAVAPIISETSPDE